MYEILRFSQYQQCKDYDIRATSLNNIYAQLELQHKLIRAATPEYSKYEYKEGTQYYFKTKSDTSPAAKAILSVASCAKTKYQVDVDAAARAFALQGVTRFDVVKKLNDWNDNQIIDLTVAGVMNTYRILKKLPTTPEAITGIADELYALMETREQQALDRTGKILDLITSPKCYSKALAQHFGDDLPDNKAGCGHCSYCMTKKQIQKPDPPHVPFNQGAFDKILDTIEDRDDPRFLARVAFGITSPRVTAMKLKRGAGSIFGSMDEHEFMVIIQDIFGFFYKDSS